VVKPITIRLILSLALSRNWSMCQLDVHNAFLHGDLQKQVFMTQPLGFIDSTLPDHVCLLFKSLYGLKQSPKTWFHKLSVALLDLGFAASSYNHSLFIAHAHGHTTIILVYVDDIIITASYPQSVISYITQHQDRFAIKDLGSLHYFLSIEFVPSSTSLHLAQPKYINDLLLRTNMHLAKPCSTPLATSISLSIHDSSAFKDPYLYRNVVGTLQYATTNRSDISFIVNKVSQFMHMPTSNH
jgi:Reverse transcriptase (RNA-dependent DNA polymerase)